MPHSLTPLLCKRNEVCISAAIFSTVRRLLNKLVSQTCPTTFRDFQEFRWYVAFVVFHFQNDLFDFHDDCTIRGSFYSCFFDFSLSRELFNVVVIQVSPCVSSLFKTIIFQAFEKCLVYFVEVLKFGTEYRIFFCFTFGIFV